jgi:low affinity Fe/Cu permease
MVRPQEGVSMSEKPTPVLLPSEVSSRIGFFDRFAGLAAKLASRAPFFAFCLLLVVVWFVQGVALIVSKSSF